MQYCIYRIWHILYLTTPLITLVDSLHNLSDHLIAVNRISWKLPCSISHAPIVSIISASSRLFNRFLSRSRFVMCASRNGVRTPSFGRVRQAITALIQHGNHVLRRQFTRQVSRKLPVGGCRGGGRIRGLKGPTGGRAFACLPHSTTYFRKKI
jgi:hypothetical protein